MFSKFKVLVLFLAVCAMADVENLSSSSAAFSFAPVGVIQQVSYFSNSVSFTCKKIAVGREGMAFSWALPKIKGETGKLSICSVSGKLIKSFNLASNEGNFTWNVSRGKMAGGVYFATLSYGQFKKSLRILY
jgi:hypothetical protein